MRTISPVRMVGMFAGLTGARIFGVSLRTIPEMNKTNNPFFGKAEKLTDLTCIVGADYTSVMNRERDRLGIVERFDPKPRQWGKHIGDTPLIEHNGSLYIEIIGIRAKSRYVDLNGNAIDKDKIDPYLRKQKPREIVINPADDKADCELTSDDVQSYITNVVYRTPKIESVESIRFGGEEFRIDHSRDSVLSIVA